MAATATLSDAGIRSAITAARATAKGQRLNLPDRERGLVLRVSTGTGAASWYFVYRRPGKSQPIRYAAHDRPLPADSI
jgi:hypothetical protein